MQAYFNVRVDIVKFRGVQKKIQRNSATVGVDSLNTQLSIRHLKSWKPEVEPVRVWCRNQEFGSSASRRPKKDRWIFIWVLTVDLHASSEVPNGLLIILEWSVSYYFYNLVRRQINGNNRFFECYFFRLGQVLDHYWFLLLFFS